METLKNWKACSSLANFPNHSSILKIIHIVFSLKIIILFSFLLDIIIIIVIIIIIIIIIVIIIRQY